MTRLTIAAALAGAMLTTVLTASAGEPPIIRGDTHRTQERGRLYDRLDRSHNGSGYRADVQLPSRSSASAVPEMMSWVLAGIAIAVLGCHVYNRPARN